MTKFMKKINTVNTQERKAIISNVDYTIDSKEDPFSSMVSYSHAVKNEFRLEYYAYAWVPENDGDMILSARKDILEKFRRDVYNDVEEGVFGIMESLYRGENEQDVINQCRELLKLIQEV